MNLSNWKSESIIDRQLSTNKKSMGLIPMSATTSISVDHPLSPLPTTDQSKSNQLNSSQQTKSYFDLKAETDLIINLNSDQNIQRPPTPSTSKFINQISNSTQHIQKPIKNDHSEDQSINAKSIVENDNPNSGEETTTVTNQTESIDNPKRDKKGKCSSDNSSINSTNGKSAEKKSVQIHLTNEPHRIKSNRQILRELKTTVNIESLSQPSSSNNHNYIKDENRIMSDLMLTIIRQLSSRLEQTKKELASSQAETQALKSLLVHSYSVGLGEIERCLVRSKVVTNNDPSSSSESNKPWTLDIPNNWNRSKDQQQQRTSDEEHPTTISINHLSNLDLEDLREAMYDNPSYETASLSSCSRSHTSPTSLINNQLPSKTFNTNSLKSLSRSSSIKPTSARPPPPLLPPPPSKSSTTKLFKKKSTIVPKTTEHHQHNRADSTSSNLSGVSSTQCYNPSTNSASGSWGFQGWKWTNKIDHHRTKIATSVADEEGYSGERSRVRNGSKGKETDDESLETQDPSQTEDLVASKINSHNKLFANLFTRRSTSLNRKESKRRRGGGGEVVDQESKKMNESSTTHDVDQSKQVIIDSKPNSIAVKSISVEEEDSTRISTPGIPFYERGQSHASGSSSHHHQLLATPASVESSNNSEFMLKTGSIRSSSCGSAISSSLNSICLSSAAFLPPPTQSSDLMEHIVCNSSNASDTSSLAVSRVLSDLPTQPPTLTTTTDIVPEFVIESTAAATLLSPALGPPSRKTSINQKSPILLPTPSMSESPFSHSSPPRIHQPQPREIY
ncbi:hypothetical protein CROQUDRAFT_249070 [Cronartium quercuum f. sp. fusiforme G11]|uniref:Uncharacterized protein n=1 Tax=Cronartium quercuum f. sp. fusiforme G11 TaxID=708437 RepID=A0A9P6NTM2_9BASI|nr:hypothetical protein CROQUDRAFT_249070 [Cronartium quercuum f. sp. fusiforme G11]